ncbi:hypothetical protein CC78DRAFT_622329 [Lojkania enalia]|uniref:Uncharacterized protein n=1 Tax=Lojkania enalia TaxID=147567 RepID=A0A9P4JVP5_9PLEO|nr:hypothetical protein CC78DRAFT_622329 [Didymosphaeria enalia]
MGWGARDCAKPEEGVHTEITCIHLSIITSSSLFILNIAMESESFGCDKMAVLGPLSGHTLLLVPFYAFPDPVPYDVWQQPKYLVIFVSFLAILDKSTRIVFENMTSTEKSQIIANKAVFKRGACKKRESGREDNAVTIPKRLRAQVGSHRSRIVRNYIF